MDQIFKWLSQLFLDPRHTRTLLLILLACTFFPFYLLTCYMADKGFYAYEAFTSFFGFIIPFLLMAFIVGIVLTIFSAILWGGFLIALARLCAPPVALPMADPLVVSVQPAVEQKSLAETVRQSYLIFAVNAFLLGLIGYGMYSGSLGEAKGFIKFLVIGSFIVGCLWVVIGARKPAERFTLCVLLFVIGMFSPIVAREFVNSAVEATLAQFRLGNVLVTVSPNLAGPLASPDAPDILHGKLVLLTASNLYLEAGCPHRLLIVPREKSMRLEFAPIRTAGLKEFVCTKSPATPK